MSLLSDDVEQKLTRLEEALTEVENRLVPITDGNLDEVPAARPRTH